MQRNKWFGYALHLFGREALFAAILHTNKRWTQQAPAGFTLGSSFVCIVKGSGYVSRQCSGSSEIELGSVYAAELGISLFSDINRYSLENAEVELIFHMNLSDDTVEDVPMGIFYVAEANRKIKTLEIKAYDAMLNFDKAYIVATQLSHFLSRIALG